MSLAAIHQRMKAAAGVARLPLRAGKWTGVAGSVLGHGTGSSIDFQDQRQYMPGDDPRHINWQAYARTGSYTMKLYRQEVTPRVDLIFDASGSMFLNDAKMTRTWELLYFCLESALRLGASLKLHTLHRRRGDTHRPRPGLRLAGPAGTGECGLLCAAPACAAPRGLAPRRHQRSAE